MADTPPTEAASRKCESCPFKGPPDSFPLNARTGKRTRRCQPCNDKNARQAKERRAAKKEQRPSAPAGTDEPQASAAGCECARQQCACAHGEPRPPPVVVDTTGDPLTWSAFSTLLHGHRLQASDITAVVALEDTTDELDGKEYPNKVLAANVVRLVCEQMGYRFNLHDSERGQRTERFLYYCAQREGQQTKSQSGLPRANSTRKPEKQRASICMDRWHCGGWMSVSIVHPIDSEAVYARIHLYHGLGHPGYVDVGIPDEVKDLVREMQNSTAPVIYKEILRRYPDTVLRQHQIYSYWSSISQKRWKMDDDQVKSTHMLLEQWDGDSVQTIPVPEEAGVSSFAFAFKEVVERLNTAVVELAMDSTFKTNALGYEMYAILTEVNGQLMPLVTILTSLTDEAHPGAKERLLSEVLRWLHVQCPNSRFSLSDKDPSEINACRTVLSDAKHQLCYWHSVRYVEERLGKSTPPAAYDGREAHRVFSFIDPTWAPGVSNGSAEEDFDGRGSVPISVNSFELQVDDIPIDELATCLPPLLTMTIGDDSIPIWPAPIARKDRPALPEFCPARYRPHIVSMFRKHFHLHPSFPLDEKGTCLTAEQIHKSAVHQLYTFCWQHDLSQAWAYLWNRWYSPSQWPLWARSACRAVPVLKTTMIAESYWRIVKHRDLALFNRPRLDLLVYTLVKSTLPPILQRLHEILGITRAGRKTGLASWQEDFKAEWRELSKPDGLRNLERELAVLKKRGKGLKHVQVRADRLAEIEADRIRPRGDYHTDLQRWTCSCMGYLLNRFLTCKHLVKLANPILGDAPQRNNAFWAKLQRRRLPPYYVIPGIHEEPDPDEVYHPRIGPRKDLSRAVASPSPASSAAPSSPAAPAAELPAPIDENSHSRYYLTSPEARRIRDGLERTLDVLRQPQGVDPRQLTQSIRIIFSRSVDLAG